MKNILLFCNGLSGTGKTTFINTYAIPNGYHNLISATTRKMREGELDGVSYYFRDEKYFETEKFATYLFVNEAFWKPGEPKWLYGVPEFEIEQNLGKNLIYDVIQPRYTRELMNWFVAHKLDEQYEFKVAYFTTKQDNFEIAEQRAVMQNDLAVRRANTCTWDDFARARVNVDYVTMPRDNKPNVDLIKLVQSAQNIK
ncbi:MAG: hypothetical protein IKP24_04090 [Alphaproteobacteria bacterium]|nr:hypothetical protein [Alphaproteobacteria bacterium]